LVEFVLKDHKHFHDDDDDKVHGDVDNEMYWKITRDSSPYYTKTP
jgi:hypothetical protein